MSYNLVQHQTDIVVYREGLQRHGSFPSIDPDGRPSRSLLNHLVQIWTQNEPRAYGHKARLHLIARFFDNMGVFPDENIRKWLFDRNVYVPEDAPFIQCDM